MRVALQRFADLSLMWITFRLPRIRESSAIVLRRAARSGDQYPGNVLVSQIQLVHN